MTTVQETKISEQSGFYTVLLESPVPIEGATASALSDQLDMLLDGTGFSVFTRNKEATDGDDWEITLIHPQQPDMNQLQNILIENDLAHLTARLMIHPHTNWLEQVHRDFPPLTLGSFFIYGSHYTGEKPDGLIALNIDAATAFGSGEHETTKACLMALETLKEKFLPRKALDMGCGSGILALAIKKLWPDCAVFAVDIDPESVRVTARHADMNGLSVSSAAGDGYQTDLVHQNTGYDLIVANILAGPLVEMAPDLNKNLNRGGYGILSGLLARQERDVIAAHQAQGLFLQQSIPMNEWRALIFQKQE